MPAAQGGGVPATFALCPEFNALCASGGRSPDRIFVWDLEREDCVAQLSAPQPSGKGAASPRLSPARTASDPLPPVCAASPGACVPLGPPPWPCAKPAPALLAREAAGEPGPVPNEFMAASRHTPLLYAADALGALRIFDLRTSAVVGSRPPGPRGRLAGERPALARPHRQGRAGCQACARGGCSARLPAADPPPPAAALPAGLAAEPGGLAHQLVLGHPDGTLAFADCRMLGGSAHSSSESLRVEAGVWKTVEAHSKGGMTAVACHREAPLLATGTASQVWRRAP